MTPQSEMLEFIVFCDNRDAAMEIIAEYGNVDADGNIWITDADILAFLAWNARRTQSVYGNAREFCDACHENSIDELEAAITAEADDADLAEWKITATDWRAAIAIALRERAS